MHKLRLLSLILLAIAISSTIKAQSDFVPAPVDGAKMTLTTTMDLGEAITLRIGATPEHQNC